MGTFAKIYLAVSTVTIVILFLLLIFLRDIPSEALVAFLGVLVGSIITSSFQYMLSEANMRQQLRLAALDMRLQTAQEAYSLWRRLRRLPADDKRQPDTLSVKIINECSQWWENHSLYLTAEARKAFKDGYIAASNLVIARQQREEAKVLTKLVGDIERVGRIIEESVYLPSIGELD